MDDSQQLFCCRAVVSGAAAKNIMLTLSRDCSLQDFLNNLINESRINYSPSLYWKDADGDRFPIRTENDFRCFKQIGNNKVFTYLNCS